MIKLLRPSYSSYAEDNLYILYSQYFFQTTYDRYLFSKIRLVLSPTLYKFIVWACWAETQPCLGSKHWFLQVLFSFHPNPFIYTHNTFCYSIIKPHHPLIFHLFFSFLDFSSCYLKKQKQKQKFLLLLVKSTLTVTLPLTLSFPLCLFTSPIALYFAVTLHHFSLHAIINSNCLLSILKAHFNIECYFLSILILLYIHTQYNLLLNH